MISFPTYFDQERYPMERGRARSLRQTGELDVFMRNRVQV